MPSNRKIYPGVALSTGFDECIFYSNIIMSFFLPEMVTDLSEQLDKEVTDVHIAVIAREYMTNWEKLWPHLDLSRPQKEEISKSYIREYGEQKCECLNKWKEKKGNKATYRAFIDAAEQAKDKKLADDVREMLQTAPSTQGRLIFTKEVSYLVCRHKCLQCSVCAINHLV